MSFTLSEFINAWNDSMPMQVRDSDIKQPTETIFRRLLISILRQFYVNTSVFDNIEHESGSRLKASRVKLVATVNHFYKIAFPGAKQDFVFFDLIQPSFKKVFNVLNCLLNYSAFIQHTYSKTILVAKDQIDERNDLLIEVNRLRKEIEDVKMKDEKNINAIRNLDTKIPRQRSKITQLENLEKTLRKDLVTIQENFERTEMKITEHRSQIEETNRMMVSDQEIERINYAKMEIDKQLDEQDQLTAAGRQQFIENSHAVEKASAITSKMENLFTTSVISTDEIKKKLSMINEMSLEVASSESEVKSLGSEVTNASQILKEKSKSVKQLEKEIAALIASRDSEVGARKKKLKEKQNILRKLTVTEASLAATHQSIKKEQDSLYQIASSVIKHMSSNDYNPKI